MINSFYVPLSSTHQMEVLTCRIRQTNFLRSYNGRKCVSGREMSIGKSATQLEKKIIERLRGSASRALLHRVVVIPQGNGTWSTRSEPIMGRTVSSECALAVSAIVRDLRAKYHLELGY